jgi:STE24 endopeptidase
MIEYHVVLLGLLVGTTALSTVLSILNVRHGAREMWKNEDWLDERLGIEDPREVIDYERATTGLSLLQTWVGLVLLLGALYAGIITGAVEFLQETGIHPVLQGVAFFSGLIVVRSVVSAPFDLYSTFVVEEQFDFNEQTPGLWIRDFVLQIVLGVVLFGLLLGVLLALVDSLATLYWVVGGWAVVMAFMLVLQIVYPRVIAPLFNDFEPIEEGSLRDRVEAVFDKAGFEAEEIYTMDQSRRSSQLNAYFIGFGRAKRVVLFDTLVEKLEGAQIEGVLAHELAHWKRGHIWKMMGAFAIQLGVAFAALGYLVTTDWVYELFALPTDAAYAGLFVSALFVMPLFELVSPLVNKLSLAHEREADTFAVEVMDEGEPMVEALASLSRENLSNPFPHPWYAAFNHRHPPVPERMRYIQEASDDGMEQEDTDARTTPS